MAEGPTYFALPFKRRGGALTAGELIQCADEDTAFRRGRAARSAADGMVYFRIDCGEDGDVWSQVELLATDGDVPASGLWEDDAA